MVVSRCSRVSGAALAAGFALALGGCATSEGGMPGGTPPGPPVLVEQVVAYEHGGEELEGYLVYDPSFPDTARRPGVLIVHEWWGLGDHVKESARMLARQGYVAFACDMYGKGKLTSDPAQAGEWAGRFRGEGRALGRARALAGFEQLLRHPMVDSARTAAMGYCFGGTVALELAWAGAPLRGAVSFHGHPTAPDEEEFDRITAEVLVCHGADDGFVPQEMLDAFEDAMRRSGTPWTLVRYGDAVHSFTNPAADGHGIPGVRYDARAARQSWDHMSAFLAELFGRE